MKVDRKDYIRWKRKKRVKRWLAAGGISTVLAGGLIAVVLMKSRPDSTKDTTNPSIQKEEQLQDSKNDTQPNQEQQEVPENMQEVPENTQEVPDNQEENIDVEQEEPLPEKKTYIGVSEAGQEFAYDAELVAHKLQTYDYYHDEEKVVFLTFDDGTSSTVTPKILDILKEYEVKATFFVVGQTIENGGEKAKELIRREFEEGHALANHTYSHKYSKLYPNRTLDLDYFVEDLNRTDALLKEILEVDFKTRVFRCPGGYMSWKGMAPLKDYQKKENRVAIDWNSLIKDAEGKKKNASELFDCMIETSKDMKMVVLLMHDTYGKEETAKVLPRIIEYFQEQGYTFKTLV